MCQVSDLAGSSEDQGVQLGHAAQSGEIVEEPLGCPAREAERPDRRRPRSEERDSLVDDLALAPL